MTSTRLKTDVMRLPTDDLFIDTRPLNGGSVTFVHGDLSPQRRGTYPITMRWGAPPVTSENLEALRFEEGHVYVHGEMMGVFPELHRAVCAWFRVAGVEDEPRLTFTTGPGTPPDGKPGVFTFAAHSGAREVVLAPDGLRVGGEPASPGEVLRELLFWFMV